MAATSDVFLSTLLVSFGVFTLLAGLFTAYFGAGRSRRIGLALTIVGLLAVLIFAAFTWPIAPGAIAPIWDPDNTILAVIAVVAAGIGAFVSMGVFLMAIMRA